MTINKRVIVVGPPESNVSFRGVSGVSVDFTTIQEAIDVAKPGPGFTDRVTVLVTTGTYVEQIHCKSNVNIVGTSKESVYIVPPAGLNDAAIHLAPNVNISDLSMINPIDMGENYAIQGVNVSGIGIRNVDIFPAAPNPQEAKAGKEFGFGAAKYSLGRGISLRGDCHSVIVQTFGLSYFGNQNAIELVGLDDKNINFDCHFIDCIIDALWMNESYRGVFYVLNCFEVHLRNSIVRVDNSWLGDLWGEDYQCAAVYTRSTGGRWVNVHLEGTTLECVRSLNGRVLQLGADTTCYFKHSSTPACYEEPGSVGTSRNGHLERS